MTMIEDAIAETVRIVAVLLLQSVVVSPDKGFEKWDEKEVEAGNSSRWQLRRQKQLVPKQHTVVGDCPVS